MTNNAELRMAKVLFSCDISDSAGCNAPKIIDSCERAARALLSAGFGDVAQVAAERDTALANLAALATVLDVDAVLARIKEDDGSFT